MRERSIAANYQDAFFGSGNGDGGLPVKMWDQFYGLRDLGVADQEGESTSGIYQVGGSG